MLNQSYRVGGVCQNFMQNGKIYTERQESSLEALDYKGHNLA